MKAEMQILHFYLVGQNREPVIYNYSLPVAVIPTFNDKFNHL